MWDTQQQSSQNLPSSEKKIRSDRSRCCSRPSNFIGNPIGTLLTNGVAQSDRWTARSWTRPHSSSKMHPADSPALLTQHFKKRIPISMLKQFFGMSALVDNPIINQSYPQTQIEMCAGSPWIRRFGCCSQACQKVPISNPLELVTSVCFSPTFSGPRSTRLNLGPNPQSLS